MSAEATRPILHTQLTGTIESVSPLQRSLLFAELSGLAYYDDDVAAELFDQVGFREFRFFDIGGAQAYLLMSDTDLVIACRGTEPHEWDDIKADVDAAAIVVEALGRVHRGFHEYVDTLWPEMEKALAEDDRPLWFTGHSLGGAMATICAGRCFISDRPRMPKALYTYGSPRVGDKQFINYVTMDHTRWVNNNDIVTRVPPAWMGYRHGGNEMYLDARGRLRDVQGWGRAADRLRGFFRSLKRFRIDHFSDHSIDAYIASIAREVQQEAASPEAIS